jgi:hypothetical protein
MMIPRGLFFLKMHVSLGGEKFRTACYIAVDAKESIPIKTWRTIALQCHIKTWRRTIALQCHVQVFNMSQHFSLVYARNFLIVGATSHARCTPGKSDHVSLFNTAQKNQVASGYRCYSHAWQISIYTLVIAPQTDGPSTKATGKWVAPQIVCTTIG